MNETLKNSTGLTKDTGWQISLRRTLPYPLIQVWELLVSAEGIRTWLGTGYQGVIKPLSHIRITRHPQDNAYPRSSTIQVRVLEKGEKSILIFHEEYLPNQQERVRRRSFYLEVMEKITELLRKNR
ncbi:MAG: hypothetical protein MUO54_06400 [Anaerolineales bacterium]|nr:hypothetical protein [Anaerolineales bacterium]